MNKESDKVKVNVKAVKSLLAEHEAIRNNIRNLEKNLEFVYSTLSSGLPESLDLRIVREYILNINAALYNLKEGTYAHEQRDKNILGGLSDRFILNDIASVHGEIARVLDNAIMQLDLAMSEQWSASELIKGLRSVSHFVKVYHGMVIQHIQQEDSILNTILNNETVISEPLI